MSEGPLLRALAHLCGVTAVYSVLVVALRGDVDAAVRMGGRNGAQSARLVVLEGLDDLLARVHDERAVGEHGLADRLAPEDVDVEPGRMARVLPALGGDHQGVAGAVDRELAAADRRTLAADGAVPGERVDERVEVRAPGQGQRGAGSHG